MPRQAHTDIQTSLRMPNALYQQLASAAKANGWGVGEEMRQRLAASFATEPPPAADPNTRDFLSAVARMAAVLTEWFGPWSNDPFAGRVFHYAVSKLAVMRSAMGEDEQTPRRPKAGSLAAELFEGKPTVGGVARALVAHALAEQHAEEGDR